jgi:hypothetical protein
MIKARPSARMILDSRPVYRRPNTEPGSCRFALESCIDFLLPFMRVKIGQGCAAKRVVVDQFFVRLAAMFLFSACTVTDAIGSRRHLQ